MDKLLPELTWIKTKDEKTGTIVCVQNKETNYLVEYVPHSQDPNDDVEFVVRKEDIVEYELPWRLAIVAGRFLTLSILQDLSVNTKKM